MKTSTVKLIARVLAIAGLICACGLAAVSTLYFYNMTNEETGGFLGAFSLVMVAVTLIFFIPAYVLHKKARAMEESDERPLSDDGEPGDAASPADVTAELLPPPGETDDGEESADACSDDVGDGKRDNE